MRCIFLHRFQSLQLPYGLTLFSRERDPAAPSSPYKPPTATRALIASVFAQILYTRSVPGAAALLPPFLLLPLALVDEGVTEEDGLHGLCVFPAPPRATGELGTQHRSRA